MKLLRFFWSRVLRRCACDCHCHKGKLCTHKALPRDIFCECCYDCEGGDAECWTVEYLKPDEYEPDPKLPGPERCNLSSSNLRERSPDPRPWDFR